MNVVDQRISVKQGFEDSRIEENYQSEIFGEVEGSHDLDEAYL